MKKIILLCFFLCACVANNNRSTPSESEIKLYHEWLYAFKLQDLKINGELITRPPGISQLLFRLTLPTEGGINLKTHCVYYQIPYKKIPGVIKVEELKADAPCAEVSSGESLIELSDVKDLTVTLRNFKLGFTFDQKGKKHAWNFLLPNLSEGTVHEKYQPEKEKKLYPGMTFVRLNEETFLNQNNKYLGKLSDRISRGSGIRCQQVNKDCQVVGEDRCDECRYGWYQVVDYNCPQGGSKFCGQNHCGEKNEPACPRGNKIVDTENAGICQNDLTAVMNADHILICQ